MTITYEVGDGLYINLTNRCSNACAFCVRTIKDGVSSSSVGDRLYGAEGSLWLEREPSLDEITAEIKSRDLSKYSELVFCGYGEPTYRLRDMIKAAQFIKTVSGIPIRVNTNGSASLINRISVEEAAKLFGGCVDVVSISLNTSTPEAYVKVCRPVFGEAAWHNLLEFGAAVSKYVPKVIYSVVRGTDPNEDLELCRRLAESHGGELRIREAL
ncbi:MAG: TatD family nuclease-associated radical SAM protein [Eubacteriales bacterium]|jgi:TatD family-associated radical SAM protein